MCVCCVYMMYSILCNIHIYTGASLVAQTVKNLLAMQETCVQSLG